MSGGFVKVPDALLYDPDISDGALRAYMALARYATSCSRDTFEMTGDQLGTLLGRSRPQADRRMLELIARGLVLVEGNRGRGRPNRITVLDPQAVVFAGLHVERASADVSNPASSDLRKPASSDLSKPYIEGREDESRQRSKRTASGPGLLSPVDNGGAPRPPCPVPGHEHAMKRAYGECAACWSERTTGPPF